MSDISSINGSSSLSAMLGAITTSQSQQAQQSDPTQSVATLLGMSDGDLHTALSNGQTLSSIAKAKGVSESDLESTIAKSLQDNPPPGAPALSDSQAAQMASNIAGSQGPSGHHHHHHRSGAGGGGSTSGVDALTSALFGQGTNSATDTISSLASALGVDSDTLTQQIQSGDTSDLGSELMAALGGSATGVQYDGLL